MYKRCEFLNFGSNMSVSVFVYVYGYIGKTKQCRKYGAVTESMA